MPELILRAVREYHLWEAGARVVVGVSGGPDSVALLAGLTELPRAWRPEVCAATLDHGLRPESAAEVLAVARLAADLRVPFESGSEDVPGLAQAEGRGVEAAARKARYAFLVQTAQRRGARVVAVGHHRDDQLETTLLRLLRGSGSRGLGGMRPKRPLVGTDRFQAWLVRPLWLAGRAEVMDYLRARSLPWFHDASNDDLAARRNRIRHRLLPLLEQDFGPGVRQTLVRTAEHLRAEDEALRLWADRISRRRSSGGDLMVGPGFAHVPSAVRTRVLQGWWEARTGLPPLDARHVTALDALPPGAGLDLPHGFRAERYQDLLTLLSISPATPLTLPVPGSVEIPGLGCVTARVGPWPDPQTWSQVRSDPLAVAGDVDQVVAPLTLRAPFPSEQLLALGAPQIRPVRELLRECGLPPHVRSLQVVVMDARERVLWLAGGRQADAFRVRESTRRIVVLALQPAGGISVARPRSLS